MTWGAISLAAKSRIVRRRSSCSSVNAKSTEASREKGRRLYARRRHRAQSRHRTRDAVIVDVEVGDQTQAPPAHRARQDPPLPEGLEKAGQALPGMHGGHDD